MEFTDIDRRGLVMLGCGKMGSAMLGGWLAAGLTPAAVHVIDPAPSDWARAQGVALGGALPPNPAIALVAVKPQMMDAALAQIAHLRGTDILILSVAAGTPLAAFERVFGPDTRLIRAMPNTPAAIGQGITAIIGNAAATPADLDVAEGLLSAIGQVVRLDSEDQMDAVTGLSGSGPAYVFHLIETMAAAGAAQGLPPALAMDLAQATVAGAGALAQAAEETPAELRVNVTSPGGTTQAGLAVLMDPVSGLAPLIEKTVAAATDRSKDLRG